MDALTHLQHYKALRDLKGPFAFELEISDDHFRITWITGDYTYEVAIDPDYCEEAWEDYIGSRHYNWHEDKGFLKDMFWAFFSTVEIIEP